MPLASFDPPLSETIMQALKEARKISSFYTHQVAAINALNNGKHVIVSTSTASGKSVIYQVHMLSYDRDLTLISWHRSLCSDPWRTIVALPLSLFTPQRSVSIPFAVNSIIHVESPLGTRPRSEGCTGTAALRVPGSRICQCRAIRAQRPEAGLPNSNGPL